jgi:hypothetical protein
MPDERNLALLDSCLGRIIEAVFQAGRDDFGRETVWTMNTYVLKM